ncbi:hypothetical protein Q4Q35_16605 [Flavivirga aquimarina]|uniref:HNH nuclease domain-containing protein n=1 Tax=Flavivirga aquimarina TaxID=2027862 RepID=A0ABT8WE38_9FLAO|nr:hypothetical protein [Flavivirga aquimarina]MDO5971429.1 hypothetical protein [Flavivirga aquimarina]
MIKIERPEQPDIPIYTTKNSTLDRNAAKDTALRDKLKLLIDGALPHFENIFDRLSTNGKFSKAETETLKAIAFFADEANFNNDKKLTTEKNLKFGVYKDDALKKKLKAVFNNKCAYCESDFTHVTPPDIEHFRPKAAINPFTNQKDETLIYPGYYWLGADWDNLLWSCPLCNRKTKQEIPDAVEPVPVGKKNRFPVNNGNRIRHHHQIVNDEESHRLLIDPCKEDPSEHLEFQTDGLVMAKLDDQGNPSPMGQASIPAYALNRADLKHWREEEIITLEGLLLGIMSSIELFINAADPDKKEAYKQRFLKIKKVIKHKLSPEAQYLAQKKVVVDAFFEQEGLEAIGLTKEGLLN